MKFAVVLAFAILLTGCGVKREEPKPVATAPGLTLQFNPPILQKEKPNLFCNPDWQPKEGEEITPVECEPLIDCNEDYIDWTPWKGLCPSKI